MSRNTVLGSGTAKGLGWPRPLARISRVLGWPGAVSRETDVHLTEVETGGSVSDATADQRPDDHASADEPTPADAADLATPDVEGLQDSQHEADDESPADAPTGSEPGPGDVDSEGPDTYDIPIETTDVPRETPPTDELSSPTIDVPARDVTAEIDQVDADPEPPPGGDGGAQRSTEPTDDHSGLDLDLAENVDETGSQVIAEPGDQPQITVTHADEAHPQQSLAATGTTPDAGGSVAVLTRPVVDDQQTLARPPGPRRAMFDQDEFDVPDAKADEAPGRAPVAAQTLPRPSSTRTFVVANQKGGVGKTTTSVNLAAALALGGLDVLVLDLDPQGNASTALGIDHAPGTPGTYEVLIEGAAIADHVVVSPEAPRLTVLPATIDLAGAEIQLVSTVARENRLRKALRAYLAEHPVDYVFLDCPPSLGLITLNALVAATEILIPIQCEYYALEGVSQLVRTINLVKGELNEDLEVSTVLLTMYDARTRLAAQVADEVRSYFVDQTLPTVIPRSVRISEAPSYGQTVLTYHPDSAGAVSYLEAAHEIARRGAADR